MLLSIPRENCDGAIIFGVPDIFYLTAFHFIPTERPIALFVDPKGKVHLFVLIG
ncbi:aminopeptidase P family N-terminal domain-containing protein [Ornithinibacillus sp. FSL M8-0202]|uniref:aminopeptidase P family N-terminal domain-containing protein n=1 Tax=unclassified Ornithinibacillus TaxID=2620869 RepID=UPI0030D05554